MPITCTCEPVECQLEVITNEFCILGARGIEMGQVSLQLAFYTLSTGQSRTCSLVYNHKDHEMSVI